MVLFLEGKLGLSRWLAKKTCCRSMHIVILEHAWLEKSHVWRWKVSNSHSVSRYQVYCTSKSVSSRWLHHHQSFGDPLADIKHHVWSTYTCGALMMLYQSEGLNRTYCLVSNHFMFDPFAWSSPGVYIYISMIDLIVVLNPAISIYGSSGFWDRSLRLIISHHLPAIGFAGPQVCIFPKRTQRGCGIMWV